MEESEEEGEYEQEVKSLDSSEIPEITSKIDDDESITSEESDEMSEVSEEIEEPQPPKKKQSKPVV